MGFGREGRLTPCHAAVRPGPRRAREWGRGSGLISATRRTSRCSGSSTASTQRGSSFLTCGREATRTNPEWGWLPVPWVTHAHMHIQLVSFKELTTFTYALLRRRVQQIFCHACSTQRCEADRDGITILTVLTILTILRVMMMMMASQTCTMIIIITRRTVRTVESCPSHPQFLRSHDPHGPARDDDDTPPKANHHHHHHV
eukprot:gene23006-biopygen14836